MHMLSLISRKLPFFICGVASIAHVTLATCMFMSNSMLLSWTLDSAPVPLEN